MYGSSTGMQQQKKDAVTKSTQDRREFSTSSFQRYQSLNRERFIEFANKSLVVISNRFPNKKYA